jgi:hypothetical protein
MISRGQIRERLRDANYTYSERGKRTEIWRQRGSGQRVGLPFRDYFTIDETGTILKQAGLTVPEIKDFLATCNKDHPKE